MAAFLELFRQAPGGEAGLFRKLSLKFHPDRQGAVSTAMFQALQEAFTLVQSPAVTSGPTALLEGPRPVDPEHPLDRADPRLAELCAVRGVTPEQAVQILHALPDLRGPSLRFVKVLLFHRAKVDELILFCSLHPAYLARGEAIETTLAFLAPPRFTLTALAAVLSYLPRLAPPHIPMVRALLTKGIHAGLIAQLCSAAPAFATAEDSPRLAGEALDAGLTVADLIVVVTAAPAIKRVDLRMLAALHRLKQDLAAAARFCSAHPAFARSADGPVVAEALLRQGCGLPEIAALVTAFPALGTAHVPVVRALLGGNDEAARVGRFCAAHPGFAASANAGPLAAELKKNSFSIDDLDVIVGVAATLAAADVPMLVALRAKRQALAASATFCVTAQAFARSADGPQVAAALVKGDRGLGDLTALVGAFPQLASAHVPTVQALWSLKVDAAAAGQFCAAQIGFAARADAAAVIKRLHLDIGDLTTLVTHYPAVTIAEVPLVLLLNAQRKGLAAVGTFCTTYAAFVTSPDSMKIAGGLLGGVPSLTLGELGTLVTSVPALSAAQVPCIKTLLVKGNAVGRVVTFCQANGAFVVSPQAVGVVNALLRANLLSIDDLDVLVTAVPGVSDLVVPLIKVLWSKAIPINDIAAFCGAHPAFAASAGAAKVAQLLLDPPRFVLNDLDAVVSGFPDINPALVPLLKALLAKGASAVDVAALYGMHPTFARSAEAAQVIDALIGPGFTLVNLGDLLTTFPGLASAHVGCVKALKVKNVAPSAIGTFCAANTAFAASTEASDIVRDMVEGYAPLDLAALESVLGARPGLRLAEVPVVKVMVRRKALAADINTFCNDHAGLVPQAKTPELVDELFKRGGNAGTIGALLTQLAGLSVAELETLICDHFAGAPMAKLEQQVNTLIASQTPQEILTATSIPASGTTQALGQKLSTLQPAVAKYIRAALNMRGWAPADMLTFLNVQAVKGTLGKPKNQNAAYWVWLFAIHHEGSKAAVGPDPIATVNVPGRGTVRIGDWIRRHVLDRHTYHNFDFWTADVINRATSSMLQPNFDIVGKLKDLLANNTVKGAVWDGRKIQVGTWEIRIGPDPDNAGGFRIGAFFPETLAEMPIPSAVMHAIHTNLIP